LTFVDIQEALAEVMAEDSARAQITTDQIIAETAKLAFVNMLDYLRIGENGEPYVDLSALTSAQAAGLLAFKYKERKDGRGEDARDVAEVEIRLSTDKFRALVKLGDRLGLWKPQGAQDDASGVDVMQLLADQRAMLEKNAEISARYLPRTKKKQAE
jgi:phage terminase small subunit